MAGRYCVCRRRSGSRPRSRLGSWPHLTARQLPVRPTPHAYGVRSGPIAPPNSLTVVDRSTSTVSLRWVAPAGTVGRLRPLHRRCVRPRRQRVAITMTGLQCGRTYSFAVDAYATDAASRSGRDRSLDLDEPVPRRRWSRRWGERCERWSCPSTPLGLAKSSSTQTTIVVSWTPSTDNVAVGGYGLYRGGAAGRLLDRACVLLFGAELRHDVLARRGCLRCRWQSLRSNVDFGGDKRVRQPAGTRSPPTAPGSLPHRPRPRLRSRCRGARRRTTSASPDTASTRTTRRRGLAPRPVRRSSGLSCGASYTLAVDAYDAAGNRSGKTSMNTATLACPVPVDVQRPSVPQGLGFGAITAYECGACLECVE